MERSHDHSRGIIPFEEYTSDFGLIDFMDQSNIDHFIELIRGVENAVDPLQFGQHNNIDECYFPDHSQYNAPTPPLGLFDFEIATNNVDTNISVPNGPPKEAEERDDQDEEIEEEEEEEGSSATTTTTTTSTPAAKKNSGKVDRSRTLISERRRRGRMKEKLYALRALVPNITKMDKASIVGDAVLYVKDLQMQTKKLKSEIAGLESSISQVNKGQENSIHQNPIKINHVTSFNPIIKKIFQMAVVQVEERGFYVRIVSRKGKGIAGLLYRVLDSFTCFNIQSSNLAATEENYVLKFNLHVTESGMDVNLSNLKLSIASAFLNQGFEFEIS